MGYLDAAKAALEELGAERAVSAESPPSGELLPADVPDACAQCGSTTWIVSLVFDDGARVCSRCLLGRGTP